MEVRKAYKFRLKTNPEIEHKLFCQAGCVRWVWNQVWRMNKRRLANKQQLIRYDESSFWLTLWKQSNEYGFLRDVHSQPLQQVLKDLDRAYRDGFDKTQPLKRMPRQKKRFKGASFRYPQGIKLDNRRVYLPKIGWVGFFKSQAIVGEIKNATVSHCAGHWYVSIQVQQTLPDAVHPATSDVGIDVGARVFAALSNGTTYAPENPGGMHATRLARAQRNMSRKVKFSNNWKKQKRKIQQIHHKIANSRKDFLHKTSTKICENQALIFIENLKVRNMSRSAAGTLKDPGRKVRATSGLNKSILDQGWGEFRRQLEYKNQWLGGDVIAIAPHYTSQECSECRFIDPGNRKTQAHFECLSCGHVENADINAAKVIRARGHRALACGDVVLLGRSMKQEPVESREAISLCAAQAA